MRQKWDTAFKGFNAVRDCHVIFLLHIMLIRHILT